MKSFSLALVLLSSLSCLAQMPVEFVNAERGKILEGVKTIPKTGAPGPVGIWGTMAFPILSAPDKDGVEIAVAAAAGYAKGRVILFGHNSYLDGNAGGDHARLIGNCVKWAGAKDKPRVGLKSVKKDVFEAAGFRAESLSEVTAGALADFEVVVINIQGITS